MRTEYTEKPDRIVNFGWSGFFCCRDIIPGEERFTGYYPPNEDLFPGEDGFTGNYQPKMKSEIPARISSPVIRVRSGGAC